jgi:hypothetical protein
MDEAAEKQEPMSKEGSCTQGPRQIGDELAIMQLLRASGALGLDEIISRVPKFGWSQLFPPHGCVEPGRDVVLRRTHGGYTLELTTPGPRRIGQADGATSSDY